MASFIVTVNVVYPEHQKSWRILHQFEVQGLDDQLPMSANAAIAHASVYDHVHHTVDHPLCYRVFSKELEREVWPGPIDEAETVEILALQSIPEWLATLFRNSVVQAKVLLHVHSPSLVRDTFEQAYITYESLRDSLLVLATDVEFTDEELGLTILERDIERTTNDDFFIVRIRARVFDMQTFAQGALMIMDEKRGVGERDFDANATTLLAHAMCASNEHYPHRAVGFSVVDISG